MQENQAWIALFRRIPANLQDVLALGLTTGSEIVVQKIVKLDPDFMIIRGRLAGTQDSGRVVMVPYNQLTFVAIGKLLLDAEVDALFGKGAPASAAEMPTPAAEGMATIAEPQPEPEPPVSESQTKRSKKPEHASKTVLLAKLRERLKEK